MKKVTSLTGIKDPYVKRILGNILDCDPLAIYSRTPATIRRLTNGLTTRQLRAAVQRGKWPMSHVLIHLCDAEWVVGYRLRKVIAEPGTKIQAYDQDKWEIGRAHV